MFLIRSLYGVVRDAIFGTPQQEEREEGVSSSGRCESPPLRNGNHFSEGRFTPSTTGGYDSFSSKSSSSAPSSKNDDADDDVLFYDCSSESYYREVASGEQSLASLSLLDVSASSRVSQVREYSFFLPPSPERPNPELKRVHNSEFRTFLSSPLAKAKDKEDEEAWFYELQGKNIDGVPCDSPSLLTSTAIIGEPDLPFKALPNQRLTEFRVAIEKGYDNRFSTMVAENPRYLVNTSNDLPTLINIGFRYNALHIACREGNVFVAREVLRLIRDLNWLSEAYGGTMVCMRERSANLLEAMLNTPEKSTLNTPLHFACKHGPPELVSVLLAEPFCKRDPLNKYGERPIDVVGTGTAKGCMPKGGSDRTKALNRIRAMLLG